MPIRARYVHTNLTARDWRRLARFYTEVLGCVPRLPERDLAGNWLEHLTSLPGAHLRGVHLALPGFPPDGPTLEIFQYESMVPGAAPVVNEPGFGHLAFAVDDVPAALAAIVAGGGGTVGELVDAVVPGVGPLELVYARDPEGNIIELQRWS